MKSNVSQVLFSKIEVLDYFWGKTILFCFFHFLKRKEDGTHIYSELEMQEHDRQCAYLYDFISLGNE